MRHLFAVSLLLVGCYRPTAAIGLPCGLDGACPSGQVCDQGRCELTGGSSPDAETLADARAIDAASTLDAPSTSTDAATTLNWASPTLVAGVNTASVEDDPSITPDHLTIVFTSTRSGNSDLYIGTRTAVTAPFAVTSLTALNSTASEGSPEISTDGLTIFFTSDRTTAGSHDIYRALNVGGVWQAPTLITELNSAGKESDVACSPDGLTVVIARDGVLMLASRATTALPFSAPVAIPALGLTGNAAPSITNSADAVYFHHGTVRDLYYTKRTGSTYATSTPITELNTAMRDAAPFVSQDERYLIFARADDIYETTR